MRLGMCLLPVLSCSSARAEDACALFTSLVERTQAVQPAAHELLWMNQIGWQNSLVEGRRLSIAQGLPIFLWVSGDEPLGRA